MNAITQTLLAGAALGALATVPAMAGDSPAFQITALHAGQVVKKTRIHAPCCVHHTTTYSVSTNVPAADLHKRVHLYATYYKLNSSETICTTPKQKITVAPKRTAYAAIGTATETYSFGCPSGPTVFYGDTYKLKEASGEGKTDVFVSYLTGWIKNQGMKYRETFLLGVNVNIGE